MRSRSPRESAASDRLHCGVTDGRRLRPPDRIELSLAVVVVDGPHERRAASATSCCSRQALMRCHPAGRRTYSVYRDGRSSAVVGREMAGDTARTPTHLTVTSRLFDRRLTIPTPCRYTTRFGEDARRQLKRSERAFGSELKFEREMFEASLCARIDSIRRARERERGRWSSG